MLTPICDTCKYPYDIRKWPCEDCLDGDRWEKKLPTNADKIRAMTDEKLAGLAFEMTNCYTCPHNKENVDCAKSKRTCIDAWLDWLKKEATE